MKRKQLFIGAFSVVLALTMSLSIYTRVHADTPNEEPCIKTDAALANTIQYSAMLSVNCPICVNDGDAYEITLGKDKFMRQPRKSQVNMVDITSCTNHTGSYCAKQYKNPAYTEPECNDILTVGTGTNP